MIDEPMPPGEPMLPEPSKLRDCPAVSPQTEGETSPVRRHGTRRRVGADRRQQQRGEACEMKARNFRRNFFAGMHGPLALVAERMGPTPLKLSDPAGWSMGVSSRDRTRAAPASRKVCPNSHAVPRGVRLEFAPY